MKKILEENAQVNLKKVRSFKRNKIMYYILKHVSDKMFMNIRKCLNEIHISNIKELFFN